MSPGTTATAEDLRIAGLVPLSSVDRPGHLSATVFCQGCPWRCGYCHNPSILDPLAPGAVPFAALAALLERRRGLLDTVVFSGGEATLQHALIPAARAVREAGFEVGLHTGGAFPGRLRALLEEGLLDWVGLDVKASRAGYAALVGRPGAAPRAERSLRLLRGSGVEHELRMTVTPGLLGQVPAVLAEVAAAGGDHLVLQRARSTGAAAGFAATLGEERDWPGRFEQALGAARARGQELGVEVFSRAA